MDLGGFLCGFGLALGVGVVGGFFVGSWAQRKLPPRVVHPRQLMEAALQRPTGMVQQPGSADGWGSMPAGRPPPPKTENPAGPRPPTPQEARATRDRRQVSDGARLAAELEGAELRGQM